MKITNTHGIGFLAIFLFPLLILSCSTMNPKDAVYFNTIAEGRVATNTPIPESLIQSNDLLSISINSLNTNCFYWLSGLFDGFVCFLKCFVLF